MPGRIFGPTGEEATGDWTEIHNLYSLPNIIRIIKLRKVGWAEHVAYTKFWSENVNGRDDLRDMGIAGSIVLKLCV
jgi:hypothetical protein